MEIEKKYQVKQLPENFSTYDSKKIEQGYLCTSAIIRIRKSKDEYILTYKSKIGLEPSYGSIASVVNEVEMPLTKEGYMHLSEKVDCYIIKKTRYLIPIHNNLIAELDIFTGKLDGLIFVEVEFEDEQEAKDFIAPEWFGEDVTFDKRYHNNYLSTLDKLWE